MCVTGKGVLFALMRMSAQEMAWMVGEFQGTMQFLFRVAKKEEKARIYFVTEFERYPKESNDERNGNQ